MALCIIQCRESPKNNVINGEDRVSIESYKDILNSTNWDTAKKELKYEFYPKDMFIDLPNNGELEIFKSSFVDARGNPFHDVVQISLSRIDNDADILKMMSAEKISDIEKVRYLFAYSVTSKTGEPIYMDKYNFPRLRFHPAEKLHNAFYGYYDSSKLKWVLPIEKKTKKEKLKTRDGMRDSVNWITMIIDHMNNDDTTYYDEADNLILPKIYTSTVLMSYYLNLKYSGLYYVGHHNGIHNEHVSIKVALNGDVDFSQDTVHLYLMMEDNGYKYYHKADKTGSNMYSFNYPLFGSGIILDTLKKHKLFAYVNHGGRYYYNLDKNLALANINNLRITLTEIDELSLINTLQHLD